MALNPIRFVFFWLIFTNMKQCYNQLKSMDVPNRSETWSTDRTHIIDHITPSSVNSTRKIIENFEKTTKPETNRQKVPSERRSILSEKLQHTKEITIKQGRIKGIRRVFPSSSGLRSVDQYLGLPYAEAPVGSRRFMPPGAALPWSGVKMAHHLPPVCPQKLPLVALHGNSAAANTRMSKGRHIYWSRLWSYLRNESEDCLYLNVYVPAEEHELTAKLFQRKHLFPVIVYVHGESFEWNAGNAYDGSVLSSYGEVIVVTINYRLGILGFLRPSLHQDAVANFGLLDQIAALHWIKENIAYFGGDKAHVTLMGHGTGSACVNYLMISPVASGLFHRAILMSGSSMSDWAVSNHSLQLTMQIGQALNCPLTDNNDQLLTCLRKTPYADMMKISNSLSQFITPFGPIVDGHVIPDQPYKVMQHFTEHFSQYDLLFGVTESESYHFLGATLLDEGLYEHERDNLLRFYMQSRIDIRPDLALAATLKKYNDLYTNPVRGTKQEHRDVVLDILSDARVVGPLMQTGFYHADLNRHTFMYVFGHNSNSGPHASLPHSVSGEELAFIFGAPLAYAGVFHNSYYTTQEKLLSEAVMSYWCNFARTGNPKDPWKDIFINLNQREWDNYNIEWPEFNKRSQAYLNIGIPPSLGYKYRQIYMNYWNKELPDELNQIAIIQRQSYYNQDYYQNTEQNETKKIGNNSNDFYHKQNMPNNTYLSRYKSSNKPFTNDRRLNVESEIVMGHINKFGTRDNRAEDPVHALKLLLQGSFGTEIGEIIENESPNVASQFAQMEKPSSLYNRPMSNENNNDNVISSSFDITEIAKVISSDNSKIKSTTRTSNLQQKPHLITKSIIEKTAFINSSQYLQQQEQPFLIDSNNLVAGINYNSIKSDVDIIATTATAGGVGKGLLREQDLVTKSETTLHLLTGLIAIFIVLNIVIYSTYFLQRKKKAKVMQRKLGGILMYEGNNDDELKRTKLSNTQYDAEDSYVIDMVRCSNTYEAIEKTEKLPRNEFKINHQLSCSTMDTHTKVCEWIDGKMLRPSGFRDQKDAMHCFEQSGSTKSSCSFSSIDTSGRKSSGTDTFGKQLSSHKVSVAIDATPQDCNSSVMQQDSIEVSKLKAKISRKDVAIVGEIKQNVIICQEVEVDNQDMLTSQVSLDNRRYSLSRQHFALTKTCKTELTQPKHSHSRSDPINPVYGHNDYNKKFATFKPGLECVIVPMAENINISNCGKDGDSEEKMLTALTNEQQRYVLKKRKSSKDLPPLFTEIRYSNSPPITMDLTTTYKRNSLRPNSFYYSSNIKQLPPAPPPRKVTTLGRFTTNWTRESSCNSNFFTTSPLMLAYDFNKNDDVEEPEIKQSTLIVDCLSKTNNQKSKKKVYSNKILKEDPKTEQEILNKDDKIVKEAELIDENKIDR